MANIIFAECKHKVLVFNALNIFIDLLKWGDLYTPPCIRWPLSGYYKKTAYKSLNGVCLSSLFCQT